MPDIAPKPEYCLKPIRQVGQLDAKTFHLGPEKDTYTIGWSNNSDFCLNCMNVRPLHSVLNFSASGNWCVTDISAVDWTVHLNWQKIDKDKRYDLSEGDVLAFGIGVNSRSNQQYQYIFSNGNRDSNLFNFDTLTYRILHLGSNETEKGVVENELMEALEKLKENCEFLGRGLLAKNEELGKLRVKMEILSNECSFSNCHSMRLETDFRNPTMQNLLYSETPTLQIDFHGVQDLKRNFTTTGNVDDAQCLRNNFTDAENRYEAQRLQEPFTSNENYREVKIQGYFTRAGNYDEEKRSFFNDETGDWCMIRESELENDDTEISKLTKLLAEKDQYIEELHERFNLVETPTMKKARFSEKQEMTEQTMYALLRAKDKELHELRELLKQPCERELQVYRELRSELTCSICVKPFVDVVTLDCSHSFCEKCIGDWMKAKDQCPTCDVQISRSFKVDALNKIIEIFKMKIERKSPVL